MSSEYLAEIHRIQSKKKKANSFRYKCDATWYKNIVMIIYGY